MVGVVTHVRELAERLPVRFELRKVGGAATIERIDA
jgi:DNA repair exonuclease SbcCD ATPase subunit